MIRILFIMLSLPLFTFQTANAQIGVGQENGDLKNDSTFTPYPITIFEDNFFSDSIGTFPKHWWIMHRDSGKYKLLNRVRNINGKKALVIRNVPEGYGVQPLFCSIGPRMPAIDYLPGSFTLEFDFLLSRQAVFQPGFFATNANEILNIYLHDKEINYLILDDHDTPLKETISIPWFHYTEWHRFALSYRARQATCYIDSKKVFTTPILTRDIFKFLLGNWTRTYPCKDSIAYTGFRLATDNYSDAANFNRLLSEKKFTTHAILFDVNKASIKAESVGFIKQLADWLKANLAVSLEIDGHTDNDGDDVANMKLSKDRAEAVKKQLVLFGIKSNRLTTVGYGSTKSIRPNTTPEGKAENRRVEFIRK